VLRPKGFAGTCRGELFLGPPREQLITVGRYVREASRLATVMGGVDREEKAVSGYL